MVERFHKFVIDYGWCRRVNMPVIWYNLIISYEPFSQQVFARFDV
jgi:hypothetical protein